MASKEMNLPPAVRMHKSLTGSEVSQTLFVIAELGVATELLDGPRTVDDLPAAVGADADAPGRIIRFRAQDGVFRTSGSTMEITDRLLADGGFTLHRVAAGSDLYSALEATLA
jgi:hypothetical protein